MTSIEAREVCRYFHQGGRDEVRALDGVSLTVQHGSIQVLIGPSGSGKSTLLALMGALDRTTRGTISFDGRDLTNCSGVELARTRRRIGFVFQSFSLVSRLPVWENITYPLVPRGVPSAERFRIAQALTERLGIADKLSGLPEELSGGEQQRVAVARALAVEPDVILADEPTSNLDRKAGRELIGILREIHTSGKTLVVATHDPDMIELATAVAELDSGRLVRASKS